MRDPHEVDRDPSDQEPPGLTGAQEREVTALLADVAAGGGPLTTPPAVVARLDEALAGLVADRATAPDAEHDRAADQEGSVVPLVRAPGRPPSQRRRRLTTTLLAAAAVVVGGYAVGNLAATGTLTGGVSDAGGGAESAAGDAEPSRDSAAAGGRAGSATTTQGEALSLVPVVRQDRLAADVRRVVQLFGSGTTGDPEDGTAEQDGSTHEARDCPVPRLTEEQRLYQVRFAGELSGLVVGPRRQGRVEVTVYSCRTGGVQLTRTLPAPPTVP